MKILRGDKVKIIIGKDKGREGEVLVASPKTNKVLVKGLGIYKKHIKASKGQAGGIVEKERAFLASNVMVI
jgi:large subunit ribosomal protein L24